MKGTSKVGNEVKKRRVRVRCVFFSAAICGFLISSEIAERDELSCVANPSVCRLHQRIPTLQWSSMNSSYCCLMEMGTQTNEEPLPGSALWVLINPDAETLMALIFQTKRSLWLAASWRSQKKRESFNQTHKGNEVVLFMSHLVCCCWKISPIQCPSVPVHMWLLSFSWYCETYQHLHYASLQNGSVVKPLRWELLSMLISCCYLYNFPWKKSNSQSFRHASLTQIKMDGV